MNSENKSLLLISVGPKTARPRSPVRPPLARTPSGANRRADPLLPKVQPVQLRFAAQCASSEQQRSKVGFPIRTFPDQSLFAAPRDLSQRTTSFIASQRQGIHQIPLWHLIALIAKARSFFRPRLGVGDKHTLARKDQFCFKRIRGSWRSAKGSTTGAYQTTENRGQRADIIRPLLSVIRHPITECASSSQCQISKRHDPSGAKAFQRRPLDDNAAAHRRSRLLKGAKPIKIASERTDGSTPNQEALDRRSIPRFAPLVEPDGIEPTTSCLQSTRSPN